MSVYKSTSIFASKRKPTKQFLYTTATKRVSTKLLKLFYTLLSYDIYPISSINDLSAYLVNLFLV